MALVHRTIVYYSNLLSVTALSIVHVNTVVYCSFMCCCITCLLTFKVIIHGSLVSYFFFISKLYGGHYPKKHNLLLFLYLKTEGAYKFASYSHFQAWSTMSSSQILSFYFIIMWMVYCFPFLFL